MNRRFIAFIGSLLVLALACSSGGTGAGEADGGGAWADASGIGPIGQDDGGGEAAGLESSIHSSTLPTMSKTPAHVRLARV
jgi:hypothetical protein